MPLFDAFTSMFSKPRTAGRPRAKRYATQGFTCVLGDVADLSSTGMKVHSVKKPNLGANQTVTTRLASSFQQTTVSARVAWVRKASGGWNIGLQFVNLTPAMSHAIESLAKFGFAEIGEPGPRRGGNFQKDEPKKGKPILQASYEVEDLYAKLGVTAAASEDDIHAAYRQLAREFHPDMNKSPDASEKFAQISKAYSVLRDEEKRARYDRMLSGIEEIADAA